MASEPLVVGRVARPHGLRGQVIVNPETDFPDERFRVGEVLLVANAGTETTPAADSLGAVPPGPSDT